MSVDKFKKSAVNDDTTVGLAALDKSDKGSYFQDFERLVWGKWTRHGVSKNPSVQAGGKLKKKTAERVFQSLGTLRSHFVVLKKW